MAVIRNTSRVCVCETWIELNLKMKNNMHSINLQYSSGIV